MQDYNARVSADVSTIYKHFSQIANRQEGYSKRQVRNVVDELQRRGDLKVEVLDRSAALGIKATEMEGILQVVTSKLTETMFDHTAGWSADPARETAVDKDQIQGRQKRGFFTQLFGGAKDTKYYTDDQYVLKRRQDIRQNVFSLVLTKNSTIRVPVDTAGNLGGLYGALREDPRYFRIVNLADPPSSSGPSTSRSTASYVDSFQDTVNFVSVNLRKTYPGQPAFTRSLRFSPADMKAGKTVQDLALRASASPAPTGRSTSTRCAGACATAPRSRCPPQEDRWLRGRTRRSSLAAALRAARDRDRRRPAALHGRAVSSPPSWSSRPCSRGSRKLVQRATLRATDAAATTKLALYHDRDTPVAVRVSWYSPAGKVEGKLQVLDSDLLYLTPPVRRRGAGGDAVSAPRRTPGRRPPSSCSPRALSRRRSRSRCERRACAPAGCGASRSPQDPARYVYLPDSARLAKDDAGRPQFSFVRYVVNAAADGAARLRSPPPPGAGSSTSSW